MGLLDLFKKRTIKNDIKKQILSSLVDDIVKMARELDYIPAGELPFIPELKDCGNDLVIFVCTYINLK